MKTNVAEVLRAELARPSWEGDAVAIGAATDPYQPAEGRYKLTRGCLEALAERSNPFQLITRGPMIVRDIDVLTEAASRARVSITFSIPTLDEDVWKKTEPGTAHPRQRLRALERLVDAGVKVGVGMAPILPGISDRPEQLREVVTAARAAGATGIWTNLLNLRPERATLPRLPREDPRANSALRSCKGRTRHTCRAPNRAVRAQVAALAKELGVRDRRKQRLDGSRREQQLSLGV